jgi:putative transposase
MISFAGKQFPKDIILMAVRWYVAYPLSYRNIEELMAERNVKVDHATLNRWVVEYSPQLESEFRKNYKNKTNSSWRMDETYLKIKGKDIYLYRAVDKFGKTIDFMVSEKRDKEAALSFFNKAIGENGLPEKVTMDKSGANKAGIDAINLFLFSMFYMAKTIFQITVRQIKYLNNILEQDHRAIKRITKPMMGFKALHSAEATIAGIELHHMLKKGQHKNVGQQTVFEQFYALAG